MKTIPRLVAATQISNFREKTDVNVSITLKTLSLTKIKQSIFLKKIAKFRSIVSDVSLVSREHDSNKTPYLGIFDISGQDNFGKKNL
jgi:hypothetical protein